MKKVGSGTIMTSVFRVFSGGDSVVCEKDGVFVHSDALEGKGKERKGKERKGKERKGNGGGLS